MDYNEAYSQVPGYFGDEPDELLQRYWERLDPEKPVLDLGAGQGRHALFLARKGFAVDAVDPSQVAVETIQGIASEQSLSIRTVHGGFACVPSDGDYGGVLLFGLLQLLRRDEIEDLVSRIPAWLAAGGLVWITAFATDDPALTRIAAEWEQIAPGSYRSPDGEVATYLEPDEPMRMFTGYDVVHHWHGLGPEHRHGDGPLERHARLEAILRKPPNR